MENTYTYTARSANDPAKVVTFTLHDHSLSVEPGAPLEQIARMIEARTQEENGDIAPSSDLGWLQPAGVSLFQHRTGPFGLADVDVQELENGLSLVAWGRLGGLRLVRFPFTLPNVDNPDGVRNFVKEYEARRKTSPSATMLPGPFDYWATWAAVAVSALVAAVVLGRRKAS